MTKTLVVAANNKEDVNWIQDVPNTFQENGWLKSVDTTYQPHGREAHTYLEFIVGHYNEIAPKDEIIFCQGNPFHHDLEFKEHLKDDTIRYYGRVVECNSIGEPHCTFTPLHAWSELLKLPLHDNYKFVAGAQYRLTGSQIKKQSHDFYNACFGLTKIPNNKSAWVCERLWPIIWGIEL